MDPFEWKSQVGDVYSRPEATERVLGYLRGLAAGS
jgi:hypothetical protein